MYYIKIYTTIDTYIRYNIILYYVYIITGTLLLWSEWQRGGEGDGSRLKKKLRNIIMIKI